MYITSYLKSGYHVEEPHVVGDTEYYFNTSLRDVDPFAPSGIEATEEEATGTTFGEIFGPGWPTDGEIPGVPGWVER